MSIIELHGTAELFQKLKSIEDVKLSVKILSAAAKTAFKPVLDAARGMVPVDTGDLHDSIKITVRKRKNSISVGLKIGKGKDEFGVPPARRWHFIELGTADSAPHPFLRPALDHNAQAVLAGLKSELASILSGGT